MISQTKDDDVKPDDSGLVSGSGMRKCCSTATDARISRLGARRFCRLTDLLPLPETSKFPSRHRGQFHPSCLGWTRRVRTVALENLSSGPVTVRQVTRGASLTWSDHVQNLPEYLRIPQKLPQKKIAWISHAAGFGGSGKSDEEIQEFYSRQNLGQPGCQWTHRNGVK